MKKRITSIDVLRGFAILGILIMNIVSFSMPSVSYYSPLAYDGTLPNQVVYSVSHVLADQKFMAIFSMLFGASTLLFVHSALEKGRRAWHLFYLRNFWLLVIGSLHSAFLWYGDVLFVYAVCSFFLYVLKNLSARTQLAAGFIIFLCPILVNVLVHQAVIDGLPQADQAVLMENWVPPAADIQKELDAYRGSYSEQYAFRATMWGEWTETAKPGDTGDALHGLLTLFDAFCRAFGMMLVGMACYKRGVFSNALSDATYRKMFRYGLGIGWPLSVFGLALSFSFGWDWKYAQFLGRIPNTLATPLVAFGYVAGLMLWIRTGALESLQHRFRAIGKTALSAYILQTLVATSVFYGSGLALFGHVSRLGQLFIMALIWLLLLWVAPKWLVRFRYGPLEWVWRLATHLRWFPLLRKEPAD